MAPKHTEKARAGTDRQANERQWLQQTPAGEFSFERGVWEVAASARAIRA
ncbi:Unknown protein sequence [Pseudomonas syringae pv. maculicola]|nr:Unknown protein sequence [Pseudomonas syringae pv. maculicola]